MIPLLYIYTSDLMPKGYTWPPILVNEETGEVTLEGNSITVHPDDYEAIKRQFPEAQTGERLINAHG